LYTGQRRAVGPSDDGGAAEADSITSLNGP
jgi:hypothetical protein